jgi:hypothetical protein
MFSSKSRYANLEIAKWTASDGRIIPYARRRFLPPLTEGVYIEHEVCEHDRLDNVTAHYLGDAEQYWRICDVNAELEPDQLTVTIGRRIRILSEKGI